VRDKYSPIEINKRWFIECWFYEEPPQYLYEGKTRSYLVCSGEENLNFSSKEKATLWCETKKLIDKKKDSVWV